MDGGEWTALFADAHAPFGVGQIVGSRGLVGVMVAVVGIVGIHAELARRVNLADAVERTIAVGLVEVGSERRPSSAPTAQSIRGKGRYGAVAVVVDDVVGTEVAVVAELRRAEQLELVGEHHACEAQRTEQIVLPYSYAHHLLPERLELRLLCQSDVQCHGIALLVLIHAPRLVVAHHLNLRGIVSRDVLRGEVVATAQHVEAFDIELRNSLTHVADGSVVADGYARQPFQSVLQCHVALAEERREVVRQRVALQPQRVGLHRHFLQRDGLRQ